MAVMSEKTGKQYKLPCRRDIYLEINIADLRKVFACTVTYYGSYARYKTMNVTWPSLAWNFRPREYYMILPALGISAASVTTISILVRGYTLFVQAGRNSES